MSGSIISGKWIGDEVLPAFAMECVMMIGCVIAARMQFVQSINL